jgi:hypothetical protein
MESVRPSGSPASIATPSCGWRAGPEGTPGPPPTSSSPFPPETHEVQLDEIGSFVAKKRKNCEPADPADDPKGDGWDHVASDAEHRLVLVVVPVDRSIENAEEVVAEVRDRTAARGRTPDQRRGSGLRDGDPPCLRCPRGTEADRHAWPSSGRTEASSPGRPEGRDGSQGAEEGASRGGRDRRGAGDWAGGGRGVGAIAGEPDDPHLVRGAAPLDGPAPQRAEVAEDLPIQQGLADARGDELLHQVQRHLLRAGADAAGADRHGGCGESGPPRWRPVGPIMCGHSWNGSPSRPFSSPRKRSEFRRNSR